MDNNDSLVVVGYFPYCPFMGTCPDRARVNTHMCGEQNDVFCYDEIVVHCLIHKQSPRLLPNETRGVQLYRGMRPSDINDSDIYKQNFHPVESIYFDNDEADYYKHEYNLLLAKISDIENDFHYCVEDFSYHEDTPYSYKIGSKLTSRYAIIRFHLSESHPCETVEVKLYTRAQDLQSVDYMTVADAFPSIFDWLEPDFIDSLHMLIGDDTDYSSEVVHPKLDRLDEIELLKSMFHSDSPYSEEMFQERYTCYLFSAMVQSNSRSTGDTDDDDETTDANNGED